MGIKVSASVAALLIYHAAATEIGYCLWRRTLSCARAVCEYRHLGISAEEKSAEHCLNFVTSGSCAQERYRGRTAQSEVRFQEPSLDISRVVEYRACQSEDTRYTIEPVGFIHRKGAPRVYAGSTLTLECR
jgi:hypothetical protein